MRYDVSQPGPGTDQGFISLQEKKAVHTETYVRKEARAEAMKLYSYLKEKRECYMCDRHFGSLGDEQLRIHAWSHYTAAVCRLCGFIRGRTDQLKDHRRKAHPGVKDSITLKIDKENWELANETVSLPDQCPAFPVVIDKTGKPKHYQGAERCKRSSESDPTTHTPVTKES